MTEQKEYIITEELLKQIRELIFHEDETKFEKLMWKVTSHPHDPEKLYNSCECVPLTEYASDYDKGFHQAMTLVRGWIKQGKSP